MREIEVNGQLYLVENDAKTLVIRDNPPVFVGQIIILKVYKIMEHGRTERQKDKRMTVAQADIDEFKAEIQNDPTLPAFDDIKENVLRRIKKTNG